MKRVMIVGQPGAGKSHLARKLGAITGLPVHHMDHIHWQAGWIPRDRSQRRRMALAVEDGDAWIFEGGFSTTYDHRLSRADTLIVLDPPFGLRAWRVAKRIARWYGRTRPDLPDGCPEGINLEFLRWIWRTRHTARRRNLKLIEEAGPDTRVFHLRSPREVRAFLAAQGAGGNRRFG